MYANFSSVVQIKHLSLDEDLAKDVVTSITSNKIIIVCKRAEENIINSLITQIGWRSRIQAVITVDELVCWYQKALTGVFSDELGEKIISTLSDEIKNEFPFVDNNDFKEFKNNRGYNDLCSEYWSINSLSWKTIKLLIIFIKICNFIEFSSKKWFV